MRPRLFEGMYGLGDNIYQRAFLRYYPGAYLRTPWPELYSDLDIRCIRSETTLRTQHKNEMLTDYPFYPVPRDARRIRVHYGPRDLRRGGIVDAFRHQFSVSGPLRFDLPHFDACHSAIPTGRRIAIIRPATLRTEWASGSRNPEPQYLRQAAQILRRAGYFVVSVADTEPGVEWISGAAPAADLRLHHGELNIRQLCALYEQAACVVSPVGFSLPMAVGYNIPLFVVAGGCGGHNAPDIVTSPEMSTEKIRWAMPEHYCRCTDAGHDCDKTILNFESKMQAWLTDIVL